MKKFVSSTMAPITFSLVFSAFGCGRAQSPADSIALGRVAHACASGGTWDGLECAKPHVDPEPDEPVSDDRPKPTPHRRGTGLPQPTYEPPCDCEPDDPLCSCE